MRASVGATAVPERRSTFGQTVRYSQHFVRVYRWIHVGPHFRNLAVPVDEKTHSRIAKEAFGNTIGPLGSPILVGDEGERKVMVMFEGNVTFSGLRRYSDDRD